MRYRVEQIPCPECGHEQRDVPMSAWHLHTYSALEAICVECGEMFHKPIVRTDKQATAEQETTHNGN